MQKTVLQSRLLAQPFVLRTPELQSKINEIVGEGVLLIFNLFIMKKSFFIKDEKHRKTLLDVIKNNKNVTKSNLESIMGGQWADIMKPTWPENSWQNMIKV